MRREQNDDERDFPPVTPGQKIAIQLRSGRYYSVDSQGNRTGPDKFMRTPPEVKTVREPDACYNKGWEDWAETLEDAKHGMSVCPECIDSWAMDYYISLVPNDTPVTNPEFEL